MPSRQRDELLGELLNLPALPPLDLPEDIRCEEVAATPRPRLSVKADRDRGRLRAQLAFDYGGLVVAHGRPGRGVFQAAERRLLLRDAEVERAAEARLQALGWRPAARRVDDVDADLLSMVLAGMSP